MLSQNPIIDFFLQIFTIHGTFSWAIVADNLFNPVILQGVILTILLSVISQLLGAILGLVLYFFRRSKFGALRGLGGAYIWFFRGTPLAVQVLFLYTLFGGFGLVRSFNQADIFTPLGFQDVYLGSFIPAILALSLNEGAYMAEIIRAGIDSIDVGQLEAAKSLGMTYGLAMRRIIFPQAMRVIIPPLGNEFNSMLKNSSLATFASLYELFGQAQHQGARGFAILEFLVIASCWYLVLTTIWGFVQANIERRFNVSNLEPGTSITTSWWERTFGIKRRPVVAPGAGPTIEPVPELQSDRR